MTKQKEYHILSLSGGKDSTALAFFIKDNMPEVFEQMEMVFADTEHELPETYDYLNKIEMFLNKPIVKIKPYKSFDHIYSVYNQLPSVTNRWCTVELKTKPFRKYIYDMMKEKGEAPVMLYIGIRADEANRALTANTTDNYINEKHPFIEHGIAKQDVEKILSNAGIGMPAYYKWSGRSGCYFCMFQSKNTWLNLYQHHPDLYFKAMSYEFEPGQGLKKGHFGWNREYPLREMIKPENMQKIRDNYAKLLEKKAKKHNISTKLVNMYSDEILCDEEINYSDNACKFCHL